LVAGDGSLSYIKDITGAQMRPEPTAAESHFVAGAGVMKCIDEFGRATGDEDISA
jgi:hypothetical protein